MRIRRRVSGWVAKAQCVANAHLCVSRETPHAEMPCDATDNDEEAAPLERVRSVACQTTLSQSKCRRIRSDDCYRRSGSSSEEDSYESDDSVYHQRRSAYTRRSRSSTSMYCRRVVRNIRSRWSLFVRLTVEIVISCMVLGYFLDSFVQSRNGVGIVSSLKSMITHSG